MKKFEAHILVVDDDDGIRDLVKKYLEENNFLITTANSAEKAEEKINYINDVRKTLDKAVYGHKEAKTQLERIFAQWINGESKGEIIGLEHSGTIPIEILDIYKKYKVTQTIKMSSSLKFCVLAAGEADIYAAKARAWEWDIAAGHAILEHAGGSVTNHENKKFLYGKNLYKNLPIIALRSNDLKK